MKWKNLALLGKIIDEFLLRVNVGRTPYFAIKVNEYYALETLIAGKRGNDWWEFSFYTLDADYLSHENQPYDNFVILQLSTVWVFLLKDVRLIL